MWGRNPVLETLNWGKWPIIELYLSDALPDTEQAVAIQKAEEIAIPYFMKKRDYLEKLCRHPDHQGYVAKMGEFPYTEEKQLFHTAPQFPLYVILDRMQDAFNFGAVIRSAEVLGINAIFIGHENQVGVTSHVARSSSGAVNRIPIAQTENLMRVSREMKKRGIILVGASEKSNKPVYTYDFKMPTAVVLGNEGVGISAEMIAECDELLCIPQFGNIGSLNAAVAASIFFYEARRQRSLMP